jgi:OPA family hexose phosphate transport protein UhpT-like MFS transporter
MERRGLFTINRVESGGVPIRQQRKRWLPEFLKVYSVLIVGYGAFYLLRTNFKAAQPELINQAGFQLQNLALSGLHSP